jgi:hypothetical protein
MYINFIGLFRQKVYKKQYADHAKYFGVLNLLCNLKEVR